MEAISLVISGPIKSRINRGINLEATEIYLRKFLSLNKFNEVIISTYGDELEPVLSKIATKIIINTDPGPDLYRVIPWPMHSISVRQSSNLSRMLLTTCAGLEVARNEFVIKTRVELLPTDSFNSTKIIDELLYEFYTKKELKLGILKEHYSGLKYSVDGTLGGIPDTFQIGRKDTLIDIWQSSKKFWFDNYNTLTNKSFAFPISSEQLLGYTFFSLYADFKVSKKITWLKRSYVSFQLLKSIKYSENNYFKFLKYDEVGLSKNYFKGTVHIRSKSFNSRIGFFNKTAEIVWVFLKKTKHFLRRFRKGTKLTFINWIRNYY